MARDYGLSQISFGASGYFFTAPQGNDLRIGALAA